ncbi:hypothetical protein SBBP2_2180014 [Burkholderiales bacterium]|nr:hypothetical protein SBBP2_2180014 [Burkholderiales bacterium]
MHTRRNWPNRCISRPTCFLRQSARDRQFARIDLFAREETRDFFHEFRTRSLLRASTLRANGQLPAIWLIWLGAVYQERWHGWIFAFNPEAFMSKYSLGRQLLYPIMKEKERERELSRRS